MQIFELRLMDEGSVWKWKASGRTIPSIINRLFEYFDGVLVIHGVKEKILSRLKTSFLLYWLPEPADFKPSASEYKG